MKTPCICRLWFSALPSILLSALLSILVPAGAFAQGAPYGIETRVPNSSLLIESLPSEIPGTMAIQRVFENLSFSQPVFLAQIPDGSGRLCAVEKEGRILAFPDDPGAIPSDMSVFLDISAKVASSGEQGLLGLAFDPDYAENGEFYVCYSWNKTSPGTSTISRFVADNPADPEADPATEEVLLEIPQPYSNHNGGMVAFGPDDMLYVSLGDGGSGGDPLDSGQDLSTLLGSILRIDVRGQPDPGLAYGIPPDNPFVGVPDAREEIFARGLRNPWRFSFDAQRGFLLAGDVGQGRREEIDHVESGENYGWRIMEGTLCYNPSENCDRTGLTLPLADYGRDQGNSVTGGFVYYGPDVADLYGMYVYADYGSGRVWGLRYDGTSVQGPYVLVENSGINIAGFGQDESGEVYALDLFGGGVYVLRPASGGGFFPAKLSDIPALLDVGSGIDRTEDGIVPYAPGAKLWSDGTSKERFLALPGTQSMTYGEGAGWDFPEDSVIVKNFAMPLDEADPQGPSLRLETRLLYRKNSQWHGFSYEWNEGQTDANLLWTSKTREVTVVNEYGTTETFEYLYPSRSQCLQCHTNAANGVLGLNTAQMNADFAYPASGATDNQLRTYDHIGLFSDPLPDDPENLPRMPDHLDEAAALEDRARAYLASNCSMCHRPGGPAPTSLDLRWGIPEEEMNAIDVAPGNGDLGIPDPRIVSTESTGRSVLLARVGRRDGLYQMPPLATSRIDPDGYYILYNWILSYQGPEAKTAGAADVTRTSAVLQGLLNPRGYDTDYRFEYWIDPGAADSTLPDAVEAGIARVVLGEAISDLVPDSVYRYRLIAENRRGSAEGDAESFSTRLLFVEWGSSAGGCGGADPCYSSLSLALSALEEGAFATVWTDDHQFYDEDVTFDGAKTVVLRGGWSPSFGEIRGTTAIRGAVTVAGGTVTMENMTIR